MPQPIQEIQTKEDNKAYEIIRTIINNYEKEHTNKQKVTQPIYENQLQPANS